MVHVAGTHLQPYQFGVDGETSMIDVCDFFIATTLTTQALWDHVMDADNPALHHGPLLPQENVSWDRLTAADGFIARLNASVIGSQFSLALGGKAAFRLPTETEWEYAARGGTNWRDGFVFSGRNEIETVAWYGRRHGDHSQPVAKKSPNQLGLYDMSGNLWEWCQDVHTNDVRLIPTDGSAFVGAGTDRVLRGGCFHNWAIHCTVSKRYAIQSDAHDGCIGFRLAFAVGPSSQAVE